MPEGLWRSGPWLAVARAWVLAYSGELHAAETVIEEAEQVIYRIPAGTPPENIIAEHLAGYLAAIRGYRLVMEGDVATGGEWIERANQCLPPDDLASRMFCTVVAGAAIGLNGDLEKSGIRMLSEPRILCETQNPLSYPSWFYVNWPGCRSYLVKFHR